jgi:hypothetical protein
MTVDIYRSRRSRLAAGLVQDIGGDDRMREGVDSRCVFMCLSLQRGLSVSRRAV